MKTFELLGEHYFNEIVNPSFDSDRWLAYLVLKQRHPTVSYWSYDGYHVDAIVDYTLNILWEDSSIKSADRVIVYKDVPDFFVCNTRCIVQEWSSFYKI